MKLYHTTLVHEWKYKGTHTLYVVAELKESADVPSEANHE